MKKQSIIFIDTLDRQVTLIGKINLTLFASSKGLPLHNSPLSPLPLAFLTHNSTTFRLILQRVKKNAIPICRPVDGTLQIYRYNLIQKAFLLFCITLWHSPPGKNIKIHLGPSELILRGLLPLSHNTYNTTLTRPFSL